MKNKWNKTTETYHGAKQGDAGEHWEALDWTGETHRWIT